MQPRIRLAKAPVEVYAPPMAVPAFVHEHRVTYSECTLGNHVYYARYLDILESVRGEFFRAIGHPLARLQDQDTLFPVVECRIQYKSPARYDEVLRTELWISRLERVRVGFACRMTAAGNRLVLEAFTLHVCTTLAERPRRIPSELADQLRLHMIPRTEHPDGLHSST